jgi:hypothetical protein
MSKKPTPKARVFAVETRFQQMARRPGGISREKAIEQAESKVEAAKPDYDAWLDTELQDLSGLVKKAQNGQPEPNWIESAAFRSRELRDSATTLRFELLSLIAGSLCEVFDAIEAGSEFNMEAITCHVDALMLARKMSYRRLKPEQVPELMKGLRQVVKHVTT